MTLRLAVEAETKLNPFDQGLIRETKLIPKKELKFNTGVELKGLPDLCNGLPDFGRMK